MIYYTIRRQECLDGWVSPESAGRFFYGAGLYCETVLQDFEGDAFMKWVALPPLGIASSLEDAREAARGESLRKGGDGTVRELSYSEPGEERYELRFVYP